MSVDYVALATKTAASWGKPREELLGFAWEATQGARSYREAMCNMIDILRKHDGRGRSVASYDRKFRKALGRSYDDRRDTFETVVKVLGTEASAKCWLKLHNIVNAASIDSVADPKTPSTQELEAEGNETLHRILWHCDDEDVKIVSILVRGGYRKDAEKVLGYSHCTIRKKLRNLEARVGL